VPNISVRVFAGGLGPDGKGKCAYRKIYGREGWWRVQKAVLSFRRRRRLEMFWTIAVILAVLWLLGLVSGAALGMWVHLLLLLSVVSLILAIAQRPRPAF
jgi:hypothetical protein